MNDEQGFLQAIRANPDDDALRLVYADWLEERGDIRAEFIRLHLALASLAPDHLHRVSGEHELSFLRKNIDASWLAVIEPEHARPHPPHLVCNCFDAGYQQEGTYEEDFQPKWPEMQFHLETQDTECDAWKRLLDLVEQAAADGRSDFEPREAVRDLDEWRQIVTLPATIGKLKRVKKLWLYGSHLVRIPPEIGEMTSLEEFDPYTSYQLHWYPYEITRCTNLKRSRMSTRVLYGNFKLRPPFPQLHPRMTFANGRIEPGHLSLNRWKTESVRNCSVCNQPYEDRRLHRVWISLHLASHDVFPLLVNACSEECIRRLPKPPADYVQEPHRGGLEVVQAPTRF